jgi:hypothetical protein
MRFAALSTARAWIRALLSVALLLCACFCSFPTSGHAQSAPAETGTDARELFRRGEAAYSAGNYDLAIREWTSAYRIDPRPRIQFNLSQAYERLGQLDKAMEALKSFLDAGDPDDPMYSDANARLSALNQRLALTGVMVQGGAEGGQILVDDKDWGRTPRPDKINVAPGSHTLIVRWAGRPDFRTSIVVPAGQVVEVALPADDGSQPVVAQPTEAQPTVGGSTADAGNGGMKPVVFYAIGGGLSAVGAGLLGMGVANGMAAGDCGGDTYCDPDGKDSAETMSLVGYVTGGLLLAGGVTMIVLGALKSKKDDTRTSTACGVGMLSAQCSVRF